MADTRTPTSPGEILQDELAARGLSANRLAKGIGLDPGQIVGILNGRLTITADVALRLSQYLDTPASVWLNSDPAIAEPDQGATVRRRAANGLPRG